jgi:hypothetical protein
MFHEIWPVVIIDEIHADSSPPVAASCSKDMVISKEFNRSVLFFLCVSWRPLWLEIPFTPG